MKLTRQYRVLKSIVSVTVGLTAISAGASCYIDSVAPQTAFDPQFTATEKAMLKSLSLMDKGVTNALDYQTAVITNAVNTLTAQKAVGATQLSKAIKDNTQLQATAEQQIAQSARVKKALEDYGPQGMGYEVCRVLAERQKVQRTTDIVDKDVFQLVNSEVTAAPGRYASSSNALATRLAIHNKLYCTEGQAKANLCSGNAPRAGNSLKAETLFVPAMPGTPAYDDKVAFINNMAGLPIDPVPTAQVASIRGITYSDMARRVSAIKSTALTSLKSIQAEWSIPEDIEDSHKHPTTASATSASSASSTSKALNGTTEKTILANGSTDKATPADPTKDIPLGLQVQRDVNRYLGGGDEYKEWSKSLVGSAEKGVLKEILSVKALRLYLQAQQYKQLSRMEAMLAATTSAEMYNVGMDNKIERQRQGVVTANIRKVATNTQAQ